MYSIGEVCKKLNLSVETVYYYDREGLLRQIARDHGGRRQFTKDNIQVIQMILALRHAKVPVKRIQQFLSWQSSDANELNKCFEFLDQHETILTKQIQSLTESLEYLKFKKWYYKLANEVGLDKAHAIIHENNLNSENYLPFKHQL